MKTKTEFNLFIAFVVLIYCSLVSVCYSQIDSASIQNTVTTGVNIIAAVKGTIIPNVPNEVTGSLVTLLVGFLIRFFEKRKLRKTGKLLDK
jgi:hypothetical protein